MAEGTSLPGLDLDSMESPTDPVRSAAAELRATAAALLSKADELDAAAEAADERAAAQVAVEAEPEPLAPAADAGEAAARLIALDAATSGRDRSEVEEELSKFYPNVDSSALLDRFYRDRKS